MMDGRVRKNVDDAFDLDYIPGLEEEDNSVGPAEMEPKVEEKTRGKSNEVFLSYLQEEQLLRSQQEGY